MENRTATHVILSIVLATIGMSCTKEARMHNRADWTKDPKDYYDYGCYLIANRPRTKYREGIDYIEKAAQMGYPEAMYGFGALYAIGSDPQSLPKSIYWYTRAAEADSRKAMDELENANRFGLLGLPVNVAKADEWHRRYEAQSMVEEIQRFEPIQQQAVKGSVLAMTTLARRYEGLGEAHWKTAVTWYEKAAEAGDVDSAMKLVQAYRESSMGLVKDEVKSDYWFRVWQRNMQREPVGKS